ncbi:MAG: SEC-C metal-binding domain-containing protein [Phycisphaerae bacterium]
MLDAYTRDTIENWVSDFCGGDELRAFSPATREYAADLLTKFLVAACESRDVGPADIEEADVKHALVGTLARLDVPASARGEIPGLCAALLADLESEGRLGDGRLLGAYARALREPFLEAASGKQKPHVNAGSKLGRNDPCPCGSGRKYKKCCMKE